MFADLHAIVLLGTLLVPLAAIAFSPGLRPRSYGTVFIATIPLLVLAVLCLLLLSAAGVPVTEWLFPLIGVTLAGIFVKNERGFRWLRWGLFGLAIVLCVNTMYLRWEDYATDDGRRLYQGMETSRLIVLSRDLKDAFPPDHVLPPGPVKNYLTQARFIQWDCKELEPTWHTFFTGLYRVKSVPSEAWYPGGPVATGSAGLEWRPSSPKES